MFNVSTLTAIDHITDFNVEQRDSIVFESATGTVRFVGKVVVIGETLTEAVTSLLDAETTGANQVAQFTYGDKIYLLFDADGNDEFVAGRDQIIDVTGVIGEFVDASFV